MATLFVLFAVLCSCWQVCAQQPLITFNQSAGALLLANGNTAPTILVSNDEWAGLRRAAGDLAQDFGRVTGVNGTVTSFNSSFTTNSSSLVVIAGTIGKSSLISQLVQQGKINVDATRGQWEAYQIQMVSSPINGIESAVVIAGADKRGTIYGIYDLSEQMGISPWYWWADVAAISQQSVYIMNNTKVQPSPSVKYRGIFLNDEQPALTNWINTRYPPGKYGPGFNHLFYSTVFELLLRLRANCLWPAQWGSMFDVDDPLNPATADEYGIVMGTSHTEPMMRATNEQSLFMNGSWAWATNRANVTEFMLQGAERAKPYESLYTMGMRGLGDVASPTLNSSSLETIVNVQQGLLRQVYNISNVSVIPQMWCLYKEVGGYFADGMDVPEDITLLWSDDNWANMQRLPLSNETGRSGGAGIYYHADYVGDPRDYKWIDTNSLQKYWSELQQAYDRQARTIWILNVGDLKPMEVPISYFLSAAYDAPSLASPNSTHTWLSQWVARQFGSEVADTTATILLNYSVYAARRKYELVDPTTYSIINYNEANNVLQQWTDLVNAASQTYNQLDPALQPSYFELVLHKCMAGHIVHSIHINAARNNLYEEQGRTSTNALAQTVLNSFAQDHALTQRYHQLLNGKWNHMMDQTHLGYYYWQQPMRNSLPPLGYVQQQEISVAGQLGVTCDGNNGTVPGDDMYHTLSSNVLTLPPMDPYGPSRWIELFSRGTDAVNFKVSSEQHITVSPSSGVLQANGNSTDIRMTVSVDWANAPNGSTFSTINITTTTPTGKYLNGTYPYGNFNMPQISVPVNKTSVPASFHGFVESDRTISIEPEHFSANISNNTSTSNGSAYYQVIPSYGRTLSGVGLFPFTAPSQHAATKSSDTSPKLVYNFYTFTPNVTNANLTLYAGTAMNTDPSRPLKYAVSIDDAAPKIIQPNPLTHLWPLPDMWDGMVANAAMTTTTTHDLGKPGAHTLNLWLLEPGLIVQKLVLDLGGVRQSYLGPPESMIV
ncbi:hypothetical protein LTR72_006604 [Exophiala xenobiotica]|nr:hypothetical protein LTR72_006604 [Exophiala xenobiotica]KAK5287265.1 hypothetical protein LTR14_009329 [Exophiala xenobiotica]KAK5325110.1 hypothetical protein LTR93_004587 [Exophiala xenobiotica]KAK5415859.1 hypothetical protein LTR06_003911 [Exophiala xenobiotica]KAK5475382.1 hypothetical protein LTR55_009386 [Exophiala xenobiotica]